MTYQAGDLLEDTRVEAAADVPGRYHATISPAWNIVYVFGGVTMAAALSGARAALAQAHFQPLTATGTFLAPVNAGPVVLDVRSLRRGKGAEQLTVELREERSQAPALHLITTFGPKRESDIRVVDVAFPDAPLPNDIPAHVPRPGASLLMLPYYHSIETRVPAAAAKDDPHALAGSLRSDQPAARSRWVGWLRYKNTPRLADGSLDPLAYVPACDVVGPALRILRGRGAAPVMVVSLEISVHFFERTDGEWLLQDVQVCQAGDGYVSGIVHLWDERKRLLGHALQRAMLRPRAF
jgi:acyl-CoA thioesterase